MRLLVIDDSRLDRRKIRRLTSQTKMDISVAEAPDVPTALGMVAVEWFDCILMDYRLPGSDGVELARQIQRSHGDDATPIIMLTGEASDELAKKALDAGLIDFISKNGLSAEQLRQVISNAIIKHKARRSSGETGSANLETTSVEDHEPLSAAIRQIDDSPALQQAFAADERAREAWERIRAHFGDDNQAARREGAAA